MKRTLIITMEYPPIIGGIASYTDQLAQSLSPDQFILLAPKHKQAKEFDAARPFLIIRKAFYYPMFIWPRWVRLYQQSKKLIKTYNIEQLHVHHVLPAGTVAYMIKKFLKVPYLLFSHGTDMVAASKQPRKKRLVNKICANAEQIILNSQNLQERFLALFPNHEKRCTVVYPAPDKNFLTPPNLEEVQRLKRQYALEGKKVLLTISRFAEGKGFPHLIRMMPEILRAHPHLVWLIIGDGTDAKRNEILEAIRANNLQNIVRFIGKVPHQDLQVYYHLADLFVLLTHPDEQGYEEGLGLVFLEAAIAGLPVVAGRSGGVEEAVVHGETGYVVDVKENPQAIRDSIVALIGDEKLAQSFGKTARERILQDFVWEKQLAKIDQYL